MSQQQPPYPMTTIPLNGEASGAPPPPIGFVTGDPSVAPVYPPLDYSTLPTGEPPLIASHAAPVQSQPTQFSPLVPATPNIPQGLQYLTMVDTLLVHQKVEALESVSGYETNNKYAILNSLGQHVYYAIEDNNCCTRNCCGASRPFEMIIMDSGQVEVIRIKRPYRCSTCWCPCCLQKLEVFSGNDQLLGKVSQNWSICGPSYDVEDATGQTVLKISGPFCTFSCKCYSDVKFEILTCEGKKVGKITKQWSGMTQEVASITDKFGVSFPLDLDVNVKAVLLAATFLIDFMFFEEKGEKKKKKKETVAQ